MREVWPCWRLWLEGRATLEDLQSRLSILDVVEANEALDAWKEAEHAAYQKLKNK